MWQMFITSTTFTNLTAHITTHTQWFWPRHIFYTTEHTEQGQAMTLISLCVREGFHGRCGARKVTIADANGYSMLAISSSADGGIPQWTICRMSVMSIPTTKAIVATTMRSFVLQSENIAMMISFSSVDVGPADFNNPAIKCHIYSNSYTSSSCI